MARPKCYPIPEAFYHGILRGKDGQPIFFSNEDGQIFEEGIWGLFGDGSA